MMNTTAGTAGCEMPTKLKSTTSSDAVVSPDKLSVKKSTVGYDSCLVQANKTVPINSKCFYFEMRVKNVGSNNSFASIGYTEEGYDLSDFIGMETNSAGYRGTNGSVYVGGIRSNTSCPTFTTNDVVGAGVTYVGYFAQKGAVYDFIFTKNGELVGTFSKNFQEFPLYLYPTVGLCGPNVELKVNLGYKPFAYDVDARFSYRCSCRHCLENDDTKPSSSYTEKISSKKLLKSTESLLKKSIMEKKDEVASLEAIMKGLIHHFEKYL